MPPKQPAASKSFNHWLLKAEPETRLEKGKDVKFSIDDFKACGTTEWDGVRNHQAKGFLKNGMKKGQTALFYHSSCKDPGVYGTATILVEGHPDESAFDPDHPYFDPKSKRDAPTWFCPTLEYASTLAHPVTLAMLKHLAALSPEDTQAERVSMGLDYLTEEDHRALAEMPLVGKGRLSVQPVSDVAFAAIVRMGKEGGWVAKSIKGPWVAIGSGSASPGPPEAATQGEDADETEPPKRSTAAAKAGKKRTSGAVATGAGGKANVPPVADDGLRRSKRGRT